MADLTVEIKADGVTVAHELGKSDKGIPHRHSWTTTTAEQAEKMLPTWNAAELPAPLKMSDGDASAIRDAASEFKKQRDS